MMQLEHRGKDIAVKACSRTLLPKTLITPTGISDAKVFEYLFKQSLDKPQFGRFSTNYAVVSLPEAKSFVRVIQIPKMSEAEAEVSVPYEAESFIPMPMDQVYIDWQKIGETEDKMNILMVASPKDFVDKYLEILDKCGIKTAALEVESQSCHRALFPPDSKETVLLVDLAAYSTSFVMVEDGNLQFTSAIPISGSTFTDAIASALGVSGAKAEEIKMKVGIANTTQYPNIKTAVLPVLNSLSAEIKNILKFHAEHSQKKVTRIVLLGGGARLSNLTDYLASQLQESGIEKVELGNPWQNFGLLKNTPFDPMESLSYVTVIGLASRALDYKVI